MNWIEQIRNKPVKERIRLIWILVSIVALLLVAFWIVIGNYNIGQQKDTSIFKTINQGIKDFKNNPIK